MCPRCGEGELFRREGKVNGERVMTVVFKCFFAATFEEGLTDQEMQRRLDQMSNLEEWSKRSRTSPFGSDDSLFFKIFSYAEAYETGDAPYPISQLQFLLVLFVVLFSSFKEFIRDYDRLPAVSHSIHIHEI